MSGNSTQSEVHGNATFFVYLGVLSVQLVFTGYQISAKLALDGNIDPVAFAFVRVIGTACLLYLITMLTVPREQGFPRREHRVSFVLLGIAMTCNIVGLIFALQSMSSAVVAMLQVLRPVCAALISRVLGIEYFTCQSIAGIVICMLGASAITSADVGDHVDGSPLLGFVFTCIHACGQASYVILQPALLDAGYSPVTINAHAYLVATFLVAAMLLLPIHKEGATWYEPTSSYFFIVTYSIVMVGAYTYSVMGWAAKRIGGTAVMLFMLLQAVFTIVAGHLFLHEEVNTSQAFGAAVLVFGIGVFLAGQSQPDVKEQLPLMKP